MSKLVSRILLAIFMIPAASIVYIIVFVENERSMRGNNIWLWVISGAATWIFIAAYWTFLWLGVVRFSSERIVLTITSVLGSLVLGAIGYTIGAGIDRGFGGFLASVIPPVSWLIAVSFFWRETSTERAERLKSLAKSAIVCPTCGYNLTGLQSLRCPECGTQYTLEDLLAGQPSREAADVT